MEKEFVQLQRFLEHFRVASQNIIISWRNKKEMCMAAEVLYGDIVENAKLVFDACSQWRINHLPSKDLLEICKRFFPLMEEIWSNDNSAHPRIELFLVAFMWIYKEVFSDLDIESSKAKLLEKIDSDENPLLHKGKRVLLSNDLSSMEDFIFFVHLFIQMDLVSNKRGRTLRVCGLCVDPSHKLVKGGGATHTSLKHDAVILYLTDQTIKPRPPQPKRALKRKKSEWENDRLEALDECQNDRLESLEEGCKILPSKQPKFLNFADEAKVREIGVSNFPILAMKSPVSPIEGVESIFNTNHNLLNGCAFLGNEMCPELECLKESHAQIEHVVDTNRVVGEESFHHLDSLKMTTKESFEKLEDDWRVIDDDQMNPNEHLDAFDEMSFELKGLKESDVQIECLNESGFQIDLDFEESAEELECLRGPIQEDKLRVIDDDQMHPDDNLVNCFAQENAFDEMYWELRGLKESDAPIECLNEFGFQIDFDLIHVVDADCQIIGR